MRIPAAASRSPSAARESGPSVRAHDDQRPGRVGIAAELREPAPGGRRALGRRQRVQPRIVLACDEVQRAAQQPAGDERAVRRERCIDLRGVFRRAAGAQGQPRRAQVLRLDREQVPDRASGIRRRRARAAAAPLSAGGAAGAVARPRSFRDEHAVAEVERVELQQRRIAPRPAPLSRSARSDASIASTSPPAAARRPRCSPVPPGRGTPPGGASRPSGSRRGSRAGSGPARAGWRRAHLGLRERDRLRSREGGQVVA